MALDYFDIGARVADSVGKKGGGKKKTSKRPSYSASDRKAISNVASMVTSAKTASRDQAKADREAAAKAAADAAGAEAARKYATSGSETLGVGQYPTYVQPAGMTPLTDKQKADYEKAKAGIGKGDPGGAPRQPTMWEKASENMKQVSPNGYVEQYNRAASGAITGIYGAKSPEEQKQQADFWNRYNTDLKAKRTSDFNADESFDSMTDEEYNKLTSRQRASIDWNTMMYRAQQGDFRDNKKLGGVDKRVTLDEVDADKRAKYRTAYERVFGKGKADVDVLYSPRVVGLLSKVLGANASAGGADELLEGQGYVTDRDLKTGNADKNKQITQGVAPIMESAEGTRRGWVSRMIDYQVNLTKALKASKAVIGGVSDKIDMANQTQGSLGELVDSAAQSIQTNDTDFGVAEMLRGGTAGKNGIDLGGLLTNKQQQERKFYDKIYQQASQKLMTIGEDQKWLKDSTFMTEVAQANGVKPKRFIEYATNLGKSTDRTADDKLTQVLFGEGKKP